METIEIKNASKRIIANEAMLEDATFMQVCLNRLQMTDVAITNAKIVDANLSDLEIGYAQLGGAYIHDIGLPPKGHPAYDPDAKQRPLRFENCDLNHSSITNCDMSGVEISQCEIVGMKINGILITDLLQAFNRK